MPVQFLLKLESFVDVAEPIEQHVDLVTDLILIQIYFRGVHVDRLVQASHLLPKIGNSSWLRQQNGLSHFVTSASRVVHAVLVHLCLHLIFVLLIVCMFLHSF